tara:strand:+ start:79 stop:975 length:897 start_codon:yes stop_codon:yes gene_type:complete
MATISTDNYEVMANAMGMGLQTDAPLTIPRMKINHQPIMDTVDTNGKKRQMEVVSGGTFTINNNGQVSYSEGITFRPFLQRFRYTRWVPYSSPDKDGRKGKFIKSVFVTQDTFNNNDLMDDDGSFNCGRPSGFIKDWDALPEPTRRLISSVKRVRALFGVASLNETMNDKGEIQEQQDKEIPVVWEISNKDAFKIMGQTIGKYLSSRRLLPQHEIKMTTEGKQMPNGNMVYTPIPSVDFSKEIKIGDTDQEVFANFVAWVDSQNDYITDKYNEINNTVLFSDEETSVIEEFVDVTEEF